MSTKNKLLYKLSMNGDSIVTIKNDSPICCTIDFKNDYISKFRRKYIENFEQCIQVFSWTDNSYRILEVDSILHIQPLSEVLGNGEGKEK